MIRGAQPDDAKAVAALLVRLWAVHHTAAPDAFVPTTIEEQQDLFRQQHLATARSHAFVAEANGRVVGYLWARVAEASLLDSSCETWAMAQGVSETRLTVYDANPAALAFYERLGYTTRTRTLQRRLAVEQ
jgi:acetyltransferase (GNAT) family protein